MKILLNWWQAKHSLEGDPGNRDVTERVSYGSLVAGCVVLKLRGVSQAIDDGSESTEGVVTSLGPPTKLVNLRNDGVVRVVFRG